MQTRLSSFCQRLIEGGYLLALVVAPLFFNVFSHRVFEPDKLGLVRSIATIMLVAWLVQKAEEWLGRKAAVEGVEAGLSWNRFVRLPLVVPTLLLAGVYVLATILSVVPRTSLWGSYQRLQGTYSTLSYMVIFLLMLQTLRRPAQLRRVWTTLIFTSIPIALYGLLQHYLLDPLPWGGDVSDRVASNMGNPIFVGAYLIMVVPLTLARVVELQRKAVEGLGARGMIGLIASFWAVFLVALWAWLVLGFGRGLVAGLLIIVELVLVAAYLRRPVASFILLGTYSLALCIQLVAIFFTQSRGPWLGLLVGLFFFGVFALYLFRRRALLLALVALSAVGVAFLVLINMPNTPFPQVRNMPYVGRLARLMELEGTNKVRALIWQGALEMLQSNPARALIGWGPEAMYVAYNPYYPTDLAHIEARNASPDRSHNETFDSLIITGVIGFVLYLFVFGSIFYFGLKWMELLRRPRDSLFFACLAVGGVLGIVIPYMAERSFRLAALAMPLGLLAGLATYAAAMALARLSGAVPAQAEEGQPPQDHWRRLLLAAVAATLIGHFMEINGGIAIASTRTYFWSLAAVLVVLGAGLARPSEAPAEEAAVVTAPRGGAASRTMAERRRAARRRPGATPAAAPARAAEWTEPLGVQLVALAVVIGFILATLGWNYTINPLGEQSPVAVIVTALTTMAGKNLPDQVSLGMLWMVLACALLLALSAAAEVGIAAPAARDGRWWAYALGTVLAIAGGSALVYSLIHAAQLTPGHEVSVMLYEYYALLLLLWAVIAGVLYYAAPRPANRARMPGIPAYAVLLVGALLLANWANIRIIRADAVYKQGFRFDQEGQWDNAIYYYRKALKLAPEEDYYHLFHGRALVERADAEKDAKRRDALFGEALKAISQARALNPLNTDHTANMARLHRRWAGTDAASPAHTEKLQRSLSYYDEAIQLSPHNAGLYNERGLVQYVMGDLDGALATYRRSLEVDPQYLQTFLLIGDVHMVRQQWGEFVKDMEQAVAQAPGFVQGWSAIGYGYSQLGQFDRAISANLKVLDLAPNDYNTLKNLSLLYEQTGQPQDALGYAERALQAVPQQEKAALEDLVARLREQVQGGK